MQAIVGHPIDESAVECETRKCEIERLLRAATN
jgi:hypothetical protein